MTVRNRPIHTGFETMRLAGIPARKSQGYHRFGSAHNEQMTAGAYSGHGYVTRPTEIFTDFRAR